MDIPKIVQEAAKKHRLAPVKFLGAVDNSQVFGEDKKPNKDGSITPTGFPVLLVLTGNEVKVVGEFEALDLLDRLPKP